MRNLFKKSLTLCLVAILAFSCFAGIVSAETAYTATIAVVDQTITPGTTSVDVVLDIDSSQIGINEALIEVSSDIGTIDVQANLGEYTTANNEKASIVYPGDSTNYGSFYLSVADDLTTDPSTMGSLSAATITVTFTVDENKAVGTYPINIAVDGVRAASGDEDVITFTYATANVTIAEPHVHKYTYTPNEGDKTHNGTCTCGEDAIYNEACVDGDDEDTLCDKCGGETADAPSCEHVWEFVSAIPATYDESYVETAKGSIDLKCTLCEKEETKELSFNLYSSLLTPSIDAGAETKLMFSTRKDLVEANGELEANFIVIKQTYASGAVNQTIKTIADAQVSTDSKSRTVYTFPVGVPAKQMVDNFNGMVYTCANGVWYNGYATDTSIKERAMAVVTNTTIAEKTRKLCANLLVMGAKAQDYFTYNTENLADADLIGEYADLIDYSVPDMVKDGNNFNNPYQAGEVGFKTPTLTMDDAIMINYTVLTSTYTGSEDLQNLKVVFTYTGSSGATLTETITDLTPVSNGYSFQFGVAARYMRTPVTATVYNGDVAVSAGVVFSVESLLVQAMSSNPTNTKLQTLAHAIMNYSSAAAVAFAQ